MNMYDLPVEGASVSPVGSGHINKTFRIELADGSAALLQRINTLVFTKPVELMENVVAVTDFLRKKLGSGHEDEVLHVRFTTDGQSFCRDDAGGYWRIYDFVPDAFSYDAIEHPDQFRDAGEAFGNFQRLLADFPIETLHETIERFHDTGMRLEQLNTAARENRAGRLDTCRAELDFVLNNRVFTTCITGGIAVGSVPLRVTHNDTKLNNIMFDAKTKRPKCVVDLDTVMPGSALYDFGDAIRFGASTAAEDERDLDKVHFSMELYEAFARGFLTACAGSLNRMEAELLATSAIVMTLECGMRFLADHLNGDVYFGAAYPGHNLDRCRTQFKLVAEQKAHLDEMHALTMALYNEYR